MNRSILIVICDFLLVSLLAFSTVDVSKVGQPGALSTAPTVKSASAQQDLSDVMRTALEDEKKKRDELQGQLEAARAVVTEQNQQIQATRSQLQTKEQIAAQLQQQQAALQQQYAAARTNMADLDKRLQATTIESALSKEERAAMEAEAKQQAEKAALLAVQLSRMQQTNDAILSARQALQSQLEMSQVSNHYAVAQISTLADEVAAQRQQNTHLVDGIKQLAETSSQLANEIRQAHPLTPNMIYEELATNRVLASFTGYKTGIFGTDSSKSKETRTLLVTDETNTYALCHVQDTPLVIWMNGTKWEELNGTLEHGRAAYSIQKLSFCMADPRIVVVPVPAAEVRSLGCKVYHLDKDPGVFQDAVVVGTREDYYGESSFQIDPTTPHYLKMDHNSLKGLFGKFNPSSGDLVLSKSGNLLGVMANSTYCVVLRDFVPEATIRFGPDGFDQPTAQILSTLYEVLTDLPFKLK